MGRRWSGLRWRLGPGIEASKVNSFGVGMAFGSMGNYMHDKAFKELIDLVGVERRIPGWNKIRDKNLIYDENVLRCSVQNPTLVVVIKIQDSSLGLE